MTTIRICVDCAAEFETSAYRIRCFVCAKAREAIQRLATQHLQQSIRSGRISIQNCEICGNPAEAHHDDYGRPLKVRWLCRSHHHLHHAAQDRVLSP